MSESGSSAQTRESTSSTQQHADLVSSIHDAVAGVVDVESLSGGLFGEIASHLPGRSVTGVQVDDEHVDVHFVARYGRPLPAIAEDVAAAAAPYLGGRKLRITVDDITLPDDTDSSDTRSSEDGGTPSTPPAKTGSDSS